MSVKLKWEKFCGNQYRAGDYTVIPGRKPLRGHGLQEYYPYYRGELIGTGQSLRCAKNACIAHVGNAS